MTCTRSTERHLTRSARRHARADPRRGAREHLDECETCRALERRPAAHPRCRRHARRSGAARSRLAADCRPAAPGRPRPRPPGPGRRRARQPVRLAGDRRRARPRRRRVPHRPDCRSSTTSPVAGGTAQGNAAGADAVQSGVEDLRQGGTAPPERHRQAERGTGLGRAGAAGRRRQRRSTQPADPRPGDRGQQRGLQKEPQNVAARSSLFDALQRKISLLQDTITLMNEMRKGNAAGVAQVVEGSEQIMMRRLLIVITLVAGAADAPSPSADLAAAGARAATARPEQRRADDARRRPSASRAASTSAPTASSTSRTSPATSS